MPEGSIIQKSTPIKLDFSKMECKVCRAIEVTGGTTTKPQIKKGSFVTTSDTVGEQTISAIDTSNPDYDELTLAAAETSATVGAIIALDEDLPDAVEPSSPWTRTCPMPWWSALRSMRKT